MYKSLEHQNKSSSYVILICTLNNKRRSSQCKEQVMKMDCEDMADRGASSKGMNSIDIRNMLLVSTRVTPRNSTAISSRNSVRKKALPPRQLQKNKANRHFFARSHQNSLTQHSQATSGGTLLDYGSSGQRSIIRIH